MGLHYVLHLCEKCCTEHLCAGICRGQVSATFKGAISIQLDISQVGQAPLNKAVPKLLEKGAIEPIEDDQSPGFYNCLFLIPKLDGGNRQS